MSQEAFDRGLFEGKVLAELQMIREYLEERKRVSDNLNARVTLIELEKSKFHGVTMILGSLGGMVGSGVIALVVKYLPAILSAPAK